MNRVVISCSASSSYDFLLPIAARLWRNHIGYEPMVFLIGKEVEWGAGHRMVVLQKLLSEKIYVEFVDHVDGISDATVSQSVRQHAAAKSFLDPREVLIVGDADVFPINREYYNPPDMNKYAITILHSDTYCDSHWPAHGMAMSVETWREVMGLDVGDVVGSMLKTFRDGDLAGLILAKEKDYEDSRLWYFDESNTAKKIRESRHAENILKVTARGGEMICRNGLSETVDALKYVDLHCPRPGWSVEHWRRIRAILAQVVPHDIAHLESYLAEYLRSGPLIANPFA